MKISEQKRLSGQVSEAKADICPPEIEIKKEIDIELSLIHISEKNLFAQEHLICQSFYLRVEQMEQIINYRDIPTDKRIDILNALERIGFFPAYGGVRTMQQIMEKSVPGSGPQFYFVFRENELIGYNFLIGDTKKYKAFPWLAISNMDGRLRSAGRFPCKNYQPPACHHGNGPL